MIQRLSLGAGSEPLLDARPSLDPRNADYPIRPLLGSASRPLRSYTWALGRPVLDQGSEGACVGHAWAHELAARPKVVAVESADAFRLYRFAQTVDEWEGEAYSGTSVLAGAKAVAALYPGRLAEYRWGSSLEDVLRSLSFRGPVVLGVPWLSGMARPDEQGWVRAEGDLLGWHAVVCNAVSVPGRSVTIPNSWGPGWGKDGACRLSWEGLETLLGMGADACIPVRR